MPPLSVGIDILLATVMEVGFSRGLQSSKPSDRPLP